MPLSGLRDLKRANILHRNRTDARCFRLSGIFSLAQCKSAPGRSAKRISRYRFRMLEEQQLRAASRSVCVGKDAVRKIKNRRLKNYTRVFRVYRIYNKKPNSEIGNNDRPGIEISVIYKRFQVERDCRYFR